jgi:GntR family transcriptional regulator
MIRILMPGSKAKSSPVAAAKPERVARSLERDILSGKLGYGEQLESENALVRRFAVSRNTVRKGLETLAERGLITTRVGIGSFVTFQGRTLDNALGWTRALSNEQETVETRLLRLVRLSDPELAAMLGEANPEFIAIDRTRALSRSGHVVSIERSRVPLRPSLLHVVTDGLKDGSLSATLAAAGLRGERGEEWAEIECLGTADAALAGCKPGTPYLRARRLVRDADGRVIEYVVSLLDPRHFALHLAF